MRTVGISRVVFGTGEARIVREYREILDAPDVDEVDIELVWNPPWDPRTMASEDVRMMLGIWD